MSEKKPLIKRTTTDLENEEEKVWHKQQEAILKKWSEIGSSYRFMHDRSYTKYNTQNTVNILQITLICSFSNVFYPVDPRFCYLDGFYHFLRFVA